MKKVEMELRRKGLSLWKGARILLIVMFFAAALAPGAAFGTYTFDRAWPDIGGRFGSPYGVAVDTAGNVYVADAFNHRIQKFNSSGVYQTQWGSSGSGNGQFNYPVDIAVDGSGNVYVVDAGNRRIQKFNSSGVYQTQWGSNGSGNSQFDHPEGIAVDGTGNVYVADAYNHRIQKFNSSGVYQTQWGSNGSDNGQFDFPGGIAVDSGGSVYVADMQNHRIQKFNSSGAYQTQWGSNGSGNGQFNYPQGLTVDSSGNVYVADRQNHRIQKFDSSGVYQSQWGSNGSGNGQFKYPRGVAVDSSGNVYVTDEQNNRIQKFDSSGVYQTQWDGHYMANGHFYNPNGVAVDSAGNVYVADEQNDRIQKFDSSGVYQTQWGSYGSGNGQFYWTAGIAVDNADNVYVVDRNNNRIQKFNSSGGYLTQWGSYGSGNSQFNDPIGIAVDSAGNVYVVDYGNNRIQKFNSSGVYQTQWGSLGTGNGQFSYPIGIAVDSAGNVYVADTNNHRIQKFNSSGEYQTQWGSHGSGNSQFRGPWGVAVDNGGSIYVVDTNNHRIQKFDSSGVYQTQWGSNGSGNGQFSWPEGIAVDSVGNVYIADTDNNRIQKFNSSGVYQTQFGHFGDMDGRGNGAGEFRDPSGVAADGSGNVYVVDAFNFRIQKFNSNGVYQTQWAIPGYPSNAASGPNGIAVDGSGNVYVADNWNGRIQKFNSSGVSLGTWGSCGEGVTVDSSGNVYVTCFDRIRKYNSSGVYQSQWGSSGSGNGQFSGAQGLAVDSLGYVYVADMFNNRIQKFNSSGIYQTQWGSWGSGNGQFSYPDFVAVDSSGNVYVTDDYNCRIQKFDSNGNYLTKISGVCPEGIALDGSGNIYVADTNAQRIVKFLYSETVSAQASGDGSGLITATASGINYNYPTFASATSNATQHGTAVTLTATADAGSLAAWTDCSSQGGVSGGTSIAATCTVTLNGSYTFHATLTLNQQFTVTATATGNGSGTVSSAGGISYSYPSNNTGTTSPINSGTGVTLTATAATGSTVSWTTCSGITTGNGTTSATCNYAALDSDKTVQTTFTLNQHTLTVNATGTGSGTVGGGGTYGYGTSHSITASATAGSTFASWSGDCAGSASPLSVTILDRDMTCTATFAITTFTITTSAGANGSIICAPNPANYGSSSTCSITPHTGYHVASLTVDGNTQSSTSPYVFSNVTAAHSISAIFANDNTAAGGPFAYIAAAGTNTVYVVDTGTNMVVNTISVGSTPVGVAVSPLQSRVYVTNQYSNNVSVIDAASETVIGSVAVGSSPRGVASNVAGTRIYVCNNGGSTVSVIDTGTNTVMSTVTVGEGPWGVTVNPAGNRVYVANRSSNTVSVIETTNNTVVSTLSVGVQPVGLAVSPDGSRVYVVNADLNNVSVIDTGANTVIGTINVGQNPAGVAVNPAGTRIYVGNYGSGTISVIDATTNTVIGTVSVGLSPEGIAVTPDGAHVYVANYASSNVSVIDATTNTVVSTIPVGSGPTSLGQFIGGSASHLVDMNDGTIYDTDTQLSWLKDANYARTTGYTPSGNMTWSQAVAWAASLNTGSGFAGLTGWRLPATTEPDATCSLQFNPGGSFPLQGYYYSCTGSEMGYLYYVSLGNVAGGPLTNTGPFTNIVANGYWSTVFLPDPTLAFTFNFGGGTQGYMGQDGIIYAWAVRPGARTVSTLPRTGQTTSYAAGDDGAIQAGVAWPNPRFTANSGAPDNGGSVTDNLTGLIWATNANLMPTRNPGWDTDATANDGRVTWQHALDYVAKLNAENYIGHNDWRLPNENELKSLVNGQQSNPATWLNSLGFANVVTNDYWSSTTYAYSTLNAWFVRMDSGAEGNIVKTFSDYVWPVRGGAPVDSAIISLPKTGQSTSYATGDDGGLQSGASWPSPRFFDNSDGTVTDNLTGLIWLKNANCYGTQTWADALVSANGLATGACGLIDGSAAGSWRLPNREELNSLNDLSRYNPALPEGNLFTNVQSNNPDAYWSSTSYALYSSAWTVRMYDGYVDYFNKSNSYYVWPVTGGILPDTTPDQFTFTHETNVPLNTLVMSGLITVSGINAPSPISISGGEYSVSGAFTASAGTVNNGDHIRVRLTSSDNYSTTTSATLTIGGISGTFSITTMAAPPASTYTITPSAGPNGGISPSTLQTVAYLSTPSFTITPDPGYHTIRVEGTCSGTLSGGLFTTTPITADCSISVTFGANTSDNTVPAGNKVPVTPIPEATLTFDNVTTGGTATITEMRNPSPPANFMIPSGMSYEITFTGAFTGPVTVCFSYDPASVSGNESNLKLMHREITGWVDITSPGYPDTVNHRICGVTTSFSEFAVAEPLESLTASAGGTMFVTTPGQADAVCVNYTCNGTVNNGYKLSDASFPSAANGGALYIHWGDGTPIESHNPGGPYTHNYNHIGKYKVTQTIKDSDGNGSQQHWTVNVSGGATGKGTLIVSASGSAQFNIGYKVMDGNTTITTGTIAVGGSKSIILDAKTYTVKFTYQSKTPLTDPLTYHSCSTLPSGAVTSSNGSTVTVNNVIVPIGGTVSVSLNDCNN